MYYPVIGDRVLVQFYNGVEKVWYGESFPATIIAVDFDHLQGKNHLGAPVFRPFQVVTGSQAHWVSRKEILSKLTESVK